MRKSLVALMLLASTAAYADKRGLYQPDGMQTARADIRADRRATANLPVPDCAPRSAVPLPETESERNGLLGDPTGLTFAQIEAERKNRAPLYQLGSITYAHPIIARYPSIAPRMHRCIVETNTGTSGYPAVKPSVAKP
jgi:hypothetical protein